MKILQSEMRKMKIEKDLGYLIYYEKAKTFLYRTSR